MNKKLLPLLLLLYSSFLLAQTEYKVGTSIVSIEPDNTVFSIPLAGYGYPPEGRFSIEWVKVSPSVGIKNITGLGKMLYAINENGALLRADVTQDIVEWKHLKSKQTLSFLAGMEQRLYAISSHDRLLVGKIGKNTVEWTEIASVSNVTGFTVAGGNLYISTSTDELQKGVLEEGRIVWHSMGRAKDVISMAGSDDRLYSVSKDQLLWQRKNLLEGTDWVKVGYNNGSSYTITILQIAIANGRLYAINDEGTLFIAQHNTLNDLSSRAMAMTYKDKTVVIVGVDLTGFDYSLACAVKSEIKDKYGIPEEAVFINASHSHFSPVAQWFPTWGKHQQTPDSAYFNCKIKKGIVESIEKALKNRTASTLYFGRGNTHIGANRSLSDGDAVCDSTLDIIKVCSKKKNGDALLFLTGCHPVFKNEGTAGYTISPNFPGVARRRLENKLELAQAMFIQGCAGDVNPVDYEPSASGQKLADDVLGIIEQEQLIPLSGNISYALDSVLLPANVWTREQILEFKKAHINLKGDVEAEKNVRWADMMLNYYDTNTLPQYLPVYIQTINIGNWKLVGVSREAVTEYGLAIRKLWPDKLVSVSGYTNDVPSYLPTAVHIKKQTYEGYGSFFWNAQPAIFPENVFDVILDYLKKNK